MYSSDSSPLLLRDKATEPEPNEPVIMSIMIMAMQHRNPWLLVLIQCADGIEPLPAWPLKISQGSWSLARPHPTETHEKNVLLDSDPVILIERIIKLLCYSFN